MASPNGHARPFQGFSTPNYTQVPDELFDELMPQLSDPELRILLYIIRRTFGFKKSSDDISLRQMVDGIMTGDGRVLDRGAGLSKASAARGVKGLVEKGVIVATRNRSQQRGNEPTTYRLRFRTDPLSQFETSPLSQSETPLVSNRDIQETVIQETDEDISKFERPHDAQFADGTDSTEQERRPPRGQEPAVDASDAAQRAARPLPAVSRPSGPPNASNEALTGDAGRPGFAQAREAIRATLAARMSHEGAGSRRSRRTDARASAAEPPPPSGPVAAQQASVLPTLPTAPPRRRGRSVPGSSDERDLVYAYLDDFNRELLHDDAPLASLVTQTINIFRAANIPPEHWPEYLYQARTAVREHAGSITKASRASETFKNRGPYYFAVLRNLVNPEPAGPTQPPGRTP